jgi:hypothetical protein
MIPAPESGAGISLLEGRTMCFEYDGCTEFADDRVVAAKKQHRCSECGAIIIAGEKYHRHSGKFDGNFFVETLCRRCDYDRNRVVEHELSEGCGWHEAWPPFGGLVDYLRDSDMGQTQPEDVPEGFRVGDSPSRPARAVEAR